MLGFPCGVGTDCDGGLGLNIASQLDSNVERSTFIGLGLLPLPLIVGTHWSWLVVATYIWILCQIDLFNIFELHF